MKLLSAQQIHQWDEYTIAHEPIASINLMERAALRCVEWIKERGYHTCSIRVFCGKGNNGGDGLAIARLLIEQGAQPTIYISESYRDGTKDFQTNLHRLQELTTNIHFLQSKESFPLIAKDELLIDALFGSGLNRPLQLLSAELVQHINQSGAKIISIDLPSGMAIDKSCKNDAVVCADHTLTFQSRKRCFLMTENAAFFGEVSVLDIELAPGFLATVDTVFEIVSKSQIHPLKKPRNPFSHKGNHGHALLVAGNRGKMGAAVLASRACLRTGAGLLTANVPEEYSPIIHTSVPEAMVIAREENIQFLNVYRSIGIGPGLGVDSGTEKILKHILTNYSNPLVIDADALNTLALHKDWLNLIPAGSLLSPHPKEFDRLFGACDNDFERADKAIALSNQYPFIIILKGHYTLIAANGKGWYNNTGNAGLAKGGSGDVLTGILTALLAQQYIPLHAALLGVYLHGLAADLSLGQQTMESLLATDIIEMMGKAFRTG